MAAAAVQRPGAPPPPQQRYQGVQVRAYFLVAAPSFDQSAAWAHHLCTSPLPLHSLCRPALHLEQKDSAGYRLLSAMGWREGEGLGASKQGIKSHIKVKKKFENWGVGAVSCREGCRPR